jgi:GTP cyclohydrolase II
MNTMPRLTDAPRHGPAEITAQPELRQVHRAVAELRRGAPVLLEGPAEPVVVLVAETAEPRMLEEAAQAAAGPALIVLARRRAATLLALPPDDTALLAAYAMPLPRLEASWLRSLADPTLAQSTPQALCALLTPAPLPSGAAAAVRLAKIARLLPAVVMVPAVAGADLMRVGAEMIDRYPDALSAGLRQVAEAAVPLDSAPDARVVAFRPLDGGVEHLAIIVGHPERETAPLVRVHSACLTGDLLGSLRCDCGPQLHAALARMSAEGAGVLLYLAQEGRGIGLVNKLRAYAIQDAGQDTVDANLSLGWAIDERSFLPAAIMLEQLGLPRIRLLTNNPAKIAALTACGIEVVAREPHITPPNGVNDAYLRAKANRLGHLLG